MRKALKSFEIIKKMYIYFVKNYRDLEPKLMICEKEDFDNVENALKEYEGAKNHIEALHKERVDNAIKLKALEIIKEKKVDVFRFDNLCILQNMPLFVFNNQLSEKYQLTQEEYDLLKEVL